MNDALIEQDEFSCINCAGHLYQEWHKGIDRLHGIPGTFQILKCVNCGLFTLRPKLLPQEIGKYYPDHYFSFVKAIEDEASFFRKLDRKIGLERRIRQVAKRAKKNGKILDIGCATGVFLNGMKSRGWVCYGVEPDRSAADYARKRFGLDIYHGYLEDAALPDDSYDVVTLFDVLEDTYDPLSILREIYRILKPDGTFIGIVPNAKAWENNWFGPYWVGWDVPRHYHVFTPETILQVLSICGFDHVELFSFTGRHGAFMLSVDFWLDELKAPELVKKLISIVAGSFPIRILLLPFFIILEKLNRTTSLSFSARKS